MAEPEPLPQAAAADAGNETTPAGEAVEPPQAAAPAEAAAPDVVSAAALHAEGPCEVLHLSSDRLLLSVGADGKLAGVDCLGNAPADGEGGAPPVRTWANRLAGPTCVLTAASVSHDRAWLATGQETETGIGAWVSQLDERTGRVLTSSPPKLVARFTLSVRDVRWHPALPLLGVAADDGKITLWNGAPDAAPGIRRRDLPTGSGGGGVRCIAFAADVLAAAFASGALAVYSLQDATELFVCSAWPKSVIGRERLSLAWRTDGSVLALPGEANIRLVPGSALEAPQAQRAGGSSVGGRTQPLKPGLSAELSGGHRHSTTAASWSAGGQYLATASCDAVALWAVPALPQTSGTCTLAVAASALAAARLLRVWRFDSQPVSLAWGGDTAVAVGTHTGAWARRPVPSESELKAEQAVTASQEDQQQSDPAPPGSAAVDGIAADEDCKPEASQQAALAPAEPVRQPVLQPGATCIGSKHPRRRYLAWNDYGSLKFRPPGEKTSGAGKVEVEYSRERGRSAIREFKAPHGLDLAAVGPGLFALASNAASKKGNLKPRIVVHLANPWEKASFEHVVPTGECIKALAVGRTFIAAHTEPLNLLRISSISGLPLGVVSLGGPVVCLAGYEGLLLCITRRPGPPPLEPALLFALYDVAERSRVASGALPLSAKSTLRWAGFSREAMPLALDSAGVLRALALGGGAGSPLLAASCGEWLPVAELEEGGRLLWPVRAEDGALQCAELAKEGQEPGFGGAFKFREVRFALPLGETIFPVWDQVGSVLLNSLLFSHLDYAEKAAALPAAQQQRTRRNAGADTAAAKRARVGDARQTCQRKLQDALRKMSDLEAHDVRASYL